MFKIDWLKLILRYLVIVVQVLVIKKSSIIEMDLIVSPNNRIRQSDNLLKQIAVVMNFWTKSGRDKGNKEQSQARKGKKDDY